MGGKGGLMKECTLYRCGVSSEQRLHSESSSGATPTRRKGRVGRVCVRCCSNYITLRRYLCMYAN